MNGYRRSRATGRWRRFAAALAIATFALVQHTTPASAADDVDLETWLLNTTDAPVPDAPAWVIASVSNTGTTSATNVVLDITIPPGVTVTKAPDECAVAGATVSCTYASLVGDEAGAPLWLTFAETGTYSFTSTARADQPDVDNAASAQVDVTVVDENADLEGLPASDRVVAGSRPTYRIFHDFDNNGPTATADATVAGTVTGGATIVPGSFNFFSELVDGGENVADEHCTVTPTTFSCTSVFSLGVLYAPEPFIFYDVRLPTSPATVVASATITGRADSVPQNNVSVVTLDVDAPAAEIFTQLIGVPGYVPSGTPFTIEGRVMNTGEIAADDVVAVLEAPPDWRIAAPTEPLPTGVACTIESVPDAMRCTRDTLPVGETWNVTGLLSPPEGFGSGTVTLAVSTETRELGVHPNDAGTVVNHAPNGNPRRLTITPSTELEDDDIVTLSGSGFPSESSVYYCQALITGRTPTPSDCGLPYDLARPDATGSFTLSVTVERFMIVADIGVVDCAQPQSACGIGATDFFDPNASTAIASISFTPQPPVEDPFNARITGTVTGPEDQPVAGAHVLGYRRTDGLLGTLRSTTDASGSYVLEDAEPGIPYKLVFVPPAGSNLVMEWWNGSGGAGTSSRLLATNIALNERNPVVTADAELASGGTVTGTVTDPSGAAAANVVVWLYRNSDRFVGTYATTTAADGSYRIEGVRAGTPLRLRFAPAAESGLASEWFEDAAKRTDADVLEVAVGETIGASTALTRQP